MNSYLIDEKREIRKILEHLIFSKTEIKIRIEGEKTIFTSKIIKINQKDISSETGREPELIMEKLVPEEGDILFRSSPEVVTEFFVNEKFFRCSVKNIGISDIYPHFGSIVSFPESIEIEERRREERVKMPEFV